MTQFYVLKIPFTTQYKYAWYGAGEKPRYTDDAPRCSTCGGWVRGSLWLPPYEVEIYQPSNIGDFVFGGGGADCLMTERAIQVVKSASGSCLEQVFPVQIVKFGSKNKSRPTNVQSLFGVYFQRSSTRVLFDHMEPTWQERPSLNPCPSCGPGGGGKRNGLWSSIKRVVINELSWNGEDLFIPANFHGSTIVTGKMRKAILDAQLTNINFIPVENYAVDFVHGKMPA